jgi:RecA/RadA recombinase
MTDKRLERLAATRDQMRQSYGGKAAYLASEMTYARDAISTGWLMLDYVLGIGGVATNHQTEVFGKNDIGKSSLVGLGTLRSAQAMGKLVAIVALEPSFDPQYAEKHGLDLERALILYPDDGVQAFEMTHGLVTGKETGGIPVVDYVMFDSIGAVLREEEAEKGTPSAYGASQLITSATKANLMPCFKNNVGVMYINQVRADTKARVTGLYDSPGGEALKHNVMQRIQIGPNGSPYRLNVDGSKNVIVGGPLKATVKRNKLAEGSGQVAECDFYHKEVEGLPFGIDTTKDVIATAMMAGVFNKSGAWYSHPSFPADKKGEHKLQGAPAIDAFFKEHPQSIEAIRADVLAVMDKNVAAHRRKEREKAKKG